MAKSPLDWEPQEQADKMMETLYDKNGLWRTLLIVVGLWANKSEIRRGIKIRKVTRKIFSGGKSNG